MKKNHCVCGTCHWRHALTQKCTEALALMYNTRVTYDCSCIHFRALGPPKKTRSIRIVRKL